MDLSYLLKKYRTTHKFKISDKQVNYIKTLSAHARIELDEEIREIKEEILPGETKLLQELNSKEVGKLILSLEKKSPCSVAKFMKIIDVYRIKENIERKLGRPMKDGPVTILEAMIILRPPEEFSLWSKEIPIKSLDEYEFGWQTSEYCKDGKMYYLKFYNLLMMDFDDITLELLESKLEIMEDFRFRIYKTHNGFHVFVTSLLISHNEELAYELMTNLKCDHYYISFSYKLGYKIRLSTKMGRDEKSISKYLKDMGTVEPDPKCIELIAVHDRYIKEFNDNIDDSL